VLKEDREENVKEFAAYLRDSTSGIVELEGTLLDLQMLVGVSACASSENEKSPQEIIHEAQVGLAIAATRESRIGVYSPGLDSYSEQKLSLMGNLRRAIQKNSLELHYQPQIDFSRKKIYGIEALLRWKNDEGSYYNPFEIITHAESTGVIKDLTRWIINEVFSKVESLQDVVPDLVVSINVSVLNLREDDFVDFVMKKLVEHKIKAEDIIFEITENNMI